MIYPAAVWKPVQNHYPTPLTQYLGLVVHVQQGNGSLEGWFNNPASQVSSHFWISELGDVEQYVDTDQQAWAQAEGNATYLSVETEGFNNVALSEAQVAALSRLFRWVHDVYGAPLVTSNLPGEKGLGWHGMGGVAWGDHPDCPGSPRLAQLPTVVQMAAGAVIRPPAPVKPPEPAPSPPEPRPGVPAFPGRLLTYTPGTFLIQGTDVRQWQQQMQNRGWPIGVGGSDGKYGAVDGVYGPKTATLCHDFEMNQGLEVESPYGIVGPQVWEATWGNPITPGFEPRL